MSVELEHNGERYMVDGGQWYRRLKVGEVDCDGYQIWSTEQQGWSLGVRESSAITDSDRPCRVPCTDPRPPFVVGQRVKVARKDESWPGWYSNAQYLIGKEAAVSDIEGDKLRITIVGYGHVYLPPWCLDADSEPEQ